MLFRRYSLISFGLFLINISHVCGTDETSTGIDLDLDDIANELRKDQEKLEADRKNFTDEKTPFQSNLETDVIHLNIGGEILATTRQTLTSIPKSLLSILFNDRWEHELYTDEEVNTFFDFNPVLFRHLLDQLQLSKDKGISPSSDPSSVRPFEKMLKKLRIQYLLSTSPNKNILTTNVNGQIITTQKTHLEQISNSTLNGIITLSTRSKSFDKTNVFIDNHPKLFRRLVEFRSGKKLIKIACENKSFSIIKQIAFQSTSNNSIIFCNQQVFHRLKSNISWKQNAKTIAGGNGGGTELNQFNKPHGIYVDHQQQSLYVADRLNHRVVKWKLGENNGQIVAGGNGQGNRIDQLNEPSDVIVDQNNKSLIICDLGNRRVVRWSIENQQDIQIIISNVTCWAIVMNENEDLFISDWDKHEVKRWRKGEKEGTIVAGGNGQGDQLNQLNFPTYIFIDRQETVYVSDARNDRVMKWMKDAKEGVVIAGGQGRGNSSKQLSDPCGLIVNEVGDVYVADNLNHRIMYWSSGSNEGHVVGGDNGTGGRLNQFNGLRGLSFDVDNNLYVVDLSNNRIQLFEVDKN